MGAWAGRPDPPRREAGCPLNGALARRCTVHRAAGLHYVLKMSGLRDICRALKHHVFEEMCKPRAALALVARTDVVIDRDRNDGDRVVLVQYDAQAVFQRVFFDRERR